MKLLVFLVSALACVSAVAAGTDPLTVADADRMTEETNTIIAVSSGALAFFLGWVAGAST